MTAVGAFLGVFLLKPALVISAAAALIGCLRHRSAALRHAVWTGAILAILALPLLYVALPPLRLQLLPAGPATAASGPSVPQIPNGTPVAGPSFSLEGPVEPAHRALRLTDWLPQAIVFVWLSGVLCFGIRRLRAEQSVRRLVGRARPASSRALLASVETGPTEIRLSEELATPAVTGLLRPVLLLPDAAESWPAADLAAVLRHELGHVRRRDCLLNFLADLTRVVYWCNPLVWMAVGRMRSESERACDDLVLGDGVDAQGYALLLLEVARAGMRAPTLPLAATAMARPRELESRLLAVLDDRIARTVPSRWMVIGLALAGLSVAVPAAALTLGAASPSAQIIGPEPDRAGDSLVSPRSERLPRLPGAVLSTAALAALRGPDSALAAYLLPGLSRTPRDEGDLVRERATWALSRVRDGRLIEPLLESLSAPDWREQAYAAWALAELRDPRSVPLLLPMLGHPVWRLRAMAAHALNRSADPRAEPAMAVALTDPAWQVRVEAVGYFAQLGGPQLVRRLTPRLRDRHVAVRQAAETALNPR